jgi:hypothetical protein
MPDAVATFTSKDGTPIACQKSGGGSALVLVHGTAADHARWAPIRSALEAASPSTRATGAAAPPAAQ